VTESSWSVTSDNIVRIKHWQVWKEDNAASYQFVPCSRMAWGQKSLMQSSMLKCVQTSRAENCTPHRLMVILMRAWKMTCVPVCLFCAQQVAYSIWCWRKLCSIDMSSSLNLLCLVPAQSNWVLIAMLRFVFKQRRFMCALCNRDESR